MREFGLNPAETDELEWQEFLERGDFVGIKRSTQARALDYLKAVLHLDNQHMLSQISALYEKKGWLESLGLGQELARLLLSAKPSDPKSEIDVFVRCLNLMEKKRAQFAVSEWIEERRGLSVIKEVVIGILPPD